MVRVYEILAAASDADAQYGFTEADERLWFRRRDESVTVKASFSEVPIICSMDGFRSAIKEFSSTVIRELVSMYPSLAQASVERELLTKSEAL